MVEQLHHDRLKDRASQYQILEAADVLMDAVLGSNGAEGQALAVLPALVGWLTIELLGLEPRSVVLDFGHGGLQTTTASRDFFERSLRQRGYNPVFFEARDPAAFTWAVFELERRIEAAADHRVCLCHPVIQQRPCAVAVQTRI